MISPLTRNSILILGAMHLACAATVAQERKPDPYFTETAARSTPYMPRVIIRSMREDRAGHIWFATFGGPIRYDGKSFTNFGVDVGLPVPNNPDLSGINLWVAGLNYFATGPQRYTNTSATTVQ